MLPDKPKHKILSILLILPTLLLFLPGQTMAKDNMAGWQAGSAYNQLYNAKELDKLKGRILKFKTVTPMKGMAPATAFLLEEGDESIMVHLCPQAFATAKETGIKRGAMVKVKGCWAEIDGEDVFMASKVKVGDYFEFKVRLTKDGTPFWTMTPEQLAKER